MEKLDKRNFIIVIGIIIFSIATLQAIYIIQESPVRILVKLKSKFNDLRNNGMPIEFANIDRKIGCFIVAFKDMEPEYVEPIREIVGYDNSVLFRELESKKVLVGKPPAPLLEICEAKNLLTESLDYYVFQDLDVERGLLRISHRDLTEETIQEIRDLVGHDVPIEFEEREWMDQLYIGRPILGIEALEDAEAKLGQEENMLIRSAISGITVDEKAGSLEIDLWELVNYAEVIDAIRNVVGRDTPLVFVLTHRKMPEMYDFSSASAALENYVKRLNLSDICYEIVWQTEDEADALLYFLRNGEQFQFQELRFKNINGSWELSSLAKRGAPSPSRELDIVGYLIRITSLNGQRCFSRVQPLVRNLGEETAYILSVQVEVKNSTHAYHQSYGTVGKGLRDGLIGPGEIDTLDAAMLAIHWQLDESKEWIEVPLDALLGKTCTITIKLRDGEETILAENTFIHTFGRRTE